MDEVVQKSPEFDGLYCVPATIHLAGAEIELVSMVAREQRLHARWTNSSRKSDFHYVFIDCPPSLGLLTINAFVAASEVLIPIQCEYYALEGLSQLLNNIQLIEKHLNPKLTVSTILLTMYDSRTNLANQVAEDVRDHFPKEVLDTLIPRSVRISEAPSYGAERHQLRQQFTRFALVPRGRRRDRPKRSTPLMAAKRTGLGRGIGALIPGSDSADTPRRCLLPGEHGRRARVHQLAVPGARLANLSPTDIVPNAVQPRTEFDQDALAELVVSIREIGVLQPIVVRPIAGAVRQVRADHG